jgi:type III secretion system HrpB2-like protein
MVMPAIPPLPPIDASLGAGIGGPAAIGATPPVPADLAQKFQDLMQHGTAESTSGDGHSGIRTAADALQREQTEFDELHNSMADLVQRSATMSPGEVAAANMDMVNKVTMMSFKMQTGTALAQGSNKSLQTLLKNE